MSKDHHQQSVNIVAQRVADKAEDVDRLRAELEQAEDALMQEAHTLAFCLDNLKKEKR